VVPLGFSALCVEWGEIEILRGFNKSIVIHEPQHQLPGAAEAI